MSTYEPEEDYNESMSYTDPRGGSKFKHYPAHTGEYAPDDLDDNKYWWIVPVICAGLVIIVLALVRQ